MTLVVTKFCSHLRPYSIMRSGPAKVGRNAFIVMFQVNALIAAFLLQAARGGPSGHIPEEQFASTISPSNNSKGIVECSSGRDLAKAIADSLVLEAQLLNDIVVTEADWFGIKTPVVLKRNFTIIGMQSWAVSLNLGFVREKILLRNSTVLTMSRVVLSNYRAGSATQQPGIDIVTTIEGEMAILMLVDAGVIYRTCFPMDIALSATKTFKRPTELPPGPNTYEIPYDQSNCSNSTSVPLLDRCYAYVQLCIDFGMYAGDVDANGVPRSNRYVVYSKNARALCPNVLSQYCLDKYGLLGCVMYTYSLKPPPPPPPSKDSKSSTPLIVGLVVGGVVALVLVVAVPTAVLIRRRGRGPLAQSTGFSGKGGATGPALKVVGGYAEKGFRDPLSCRDGTWSSSGAADGYTQHTDLSQAPDAMTELLGRSYCAARGAQTTSGHSQDQDNETAGHSVISPLMPLRADLAVGVTLIKKRASPSDVVGAAPVSAGAPAESSSSGIDDPGVGAARLGSGALEKAAAAAQANASEAANADLGGGGGGDDVMVTLHQVVLGKGAFGRVYEGRYRGIPVAVKVLFQDFDVCDDSLMQLHLPPPPQQPEQLQLLDALREGAQEDIEKDKQQQQQQQLEEVEEKCDGQERDRQLRQQCLSGDMALRMDDTVDVMTRHPGGEQIAQLAKSQALGLPTDAEASCNQPCAHNIVLSPKGHIPQFPLLKHTVVKDSGAPAPQAIQPAPGSHLNNNGSVALVDKVDISAAVGEAIRVSTPKQMGGNMGAEELATETTYPEEEGVPLAVVPSVKLNNIQKTLAQEVEILGRCHHPGVVRLLAACLNPPHMCLVMELMETSLDRMIFRDHPRIGLPLKTVLHIAIQLVSALEYLHPTVVHRDIKPANVLVNNSASPEPVAKLSDFGLSRLRCTVVATRTPEAGTPSYSAPECYENNTITHHADIYSLGVVIWTMLTGRRPWEGLSTAAIAYKITIMRERLPLTYLRCPKELVLLIEECFEHDPLRRPAAAEVLKRLQLIDSQMNSKASAKWSPETSGGIPEVPVGQSADGQTLSVFYL